jgi:hypothetical protein
MNKRLKYSNKSNEILLYRSINYQVVRPLQGVPAALAYPWVPPVRAVPRDPAVQGDRLDPCYPSFQEDQGDPQDPAHTANVYMKAIKKVFKGLGHDVNIL